LPFSPLFSTRPVAGPPEAAPAATAASLVAIVCSSPSFGSLPLRESYGVGRLLRKVRASQTRDLRMYDLYKSQSVI
jgi:hypothetical protein